MEKISRLALRLGLVASLGLAVSSCTPGHGRGGHGGRYRYRSLIAEQAEIKNVAKQRYMGQVKQEQPIYPAS
ncbi:MAG: hypothetical protein NT076_02280 [Candidatus Pacearchaeota archaeon]|nr:hypothetical protein [Candidatus Pacearchaeota archaeon]